MVKKNIAILVLACLWLIHGLAPVACFAFETRRVVLVGPVDTARYHNVEINNLVNERWRRVFRYPFYEVVAIETGSAAKLDSAWFEQLAARHQGDIVAATEFARLQSHMYSRGFLDDETWQETRLLLVVHTYEVKNKQHHSFSIKRDQDEPVKANGGAYELVADAMDEALQKIPFKRVPVN